MEINFVSANKFHIYLVCKVQMGIVKRKVIGNEFYHHHKSATFVWGEIIFDNETKTSTKMCILNLFQKQCSMYVPTA